MLLDTFKPTFLIQIEGQTLSKDITREPPLPRCAAPARSPSRTTRRNST
ncbi:MAG: hypothetical protein SF028_07455 [Candidatus Sumerlaeia bacterium]|nr:hypothetical protein [Candidatus Sumerlaeia bacterium]